MMRPTTGVGPTHLLSKFQQLSGCSALVGILMVCSRRCGPGILTIQNLLVSCHQLAPLRVNIRNLVVERTRREGKEFDFEVSYHVSGFSVWILDIVPSSSCSKSRRVSSSSAPLSRHPLMSIVDVLVFQQIHFRRCLISSLSC
jgi:hypothetical protein